MISLVWTGVLIIIGILVIAGVLYGLNLLSYRILKARILFRQKWDLNICCGKTDGGGINADIIKHAELPNFIRINNIYHLPFRDGEFRTVLCSHTIEHVDDPEGFYMELARVGKKVTLVIPPLWDISAVWNVFEHKWIFLTFKKEHNTLPRFIRLPLSTYIQKRRGQKRRA
ncbi:methyltransferase domain-containing protein [bacterium]